MLEAFAARQKPTRGNFHYNAIVAKPGIWQNKMGSRSCLCIVSKSAGRPARLKLVDRQICAMLR
jgi:hypothetical protein